MSEEFTLVPCMEIAEDRPNSASSLVWYPANRSRCCRRWVMVGGVSGAPEISMSIQVRLKDKSLLREQAFIRGAWVFNPDITPEQIFHLLLIMGDAARQEPEQVIVAAADEMAFHQFLDVADVRLELREIVDAMVDQ
jgi:hypothetical protein